MKSYKLNDSQFITFPIMTKKISSVGILTSGGDAPGMNAAIRAAVRTAIYNNIKVFGIMKGYNGLIENELIPMQSRSVANIIQHGGTILKTARSKRFLEYEGRKKAYENLKKHNIDGLVIIGGDGSFRGATEFSKEFDIACVGIPGTIDKDLAGTDYTIGFDTATNTAVQAIDKIRDTADAHDRLFIVEVMGRDAGYIALHSGIATGAENILIPERKTDMEELITSLQEKEKRKKLVNLVVVAEGDDFGGAIEVDNIIKKRIPTAETRICVLGHIQRGGSPTCLDRVMASRMGFAAVEVLLKNQTNVMIGIVNNKIHHTPFEKVVKSKQSIHEDWTKMAKILAS